MGGLGIFRYFVYIYLTQFVSLDPREIPPFPLVRIVPHVRYMLSVNNKKQEEKRKKKKIFVIMYGS